jgi:cobalamin synthase
MSRRLLIPLVAVATVLSIAAVPAFSQSATGSIGGRVADTAGAVLQGARITLAQ